MRRQKRTPPYVEPLDADQYGYASGDDLDAYRLKYEGDILFQIRRIQMELEQMIETHDRWQDQYTFMLCVANSLSDLMGSLYEHFAANHRTGD